MSGWYLIPSGTLRLSTLLIGACVALTGIFSSTKLLASESIPGVSQEPHPFEIWGEEAQFDTRDEYAEYCMALISHVGGPYSIHDDLYALAGCEVQEIISGYQLEQHGKAEIAARQYVTDQISCEGMKVDLEAYDISLWLDEHVDRLIGCSLNEPQVLALRDMMGMQPGWIATQDDDQMSVVMLEAISPEYWTETESDFYFQVSDGEMLGPVWEVRADKVAQFCATLAENSEPEYSYPIEQEPWFKLIPKPNDCRRLRMVPSDW